MPVKRIPLAFREDFFLAPHRLMLVSISRRIEPAILWKRTIDWWVINKEVPEGSTVNIPLNHNLFWSMKSIIQIVVFFLRNEIFADWIKPNFLSNKSNTELFARGRNWKSLIFGRCRFSRARFSKCQHSIGCDCGAWTIEDGNWVALKRFGWLFGRKNRKMLALNWNVSLREIVSQSINIVDYRLTQFGLSLFDRKQNQLSIE